MIKIDDFVRGNIPGVLHGNKHRLCQIDRQHCKKTFLHGNHIFARNVYIDHKHSHEISFNGLFVSFYQIRN